MLEKATEVHSLKDSLVDYRIVKAGLGGAGAGVGTDPTASTSSVQHSPDSIIQDQDKDQGQHSLRSYLTPVTMDHERAFRAQFLRHCPVIGDPL